MKEAYLRIFAECLSILSPKRILKVECLKDGSGTGSVVSKPPVVFESAINHYLQLLFIALYPQNVAPELVKMH